MTNIEAIKSTVAKHLQESLEENTYSRILLERGLTATVEFESSSEEFELSTADVYKTLITIPNISEGGFKLSLTEKKELRKIANGIYRKYDEPIIGQITVPRGKSRQQW